jgi:LPS-assembly protein
LRVIRLVLWSCFVLIAASAAAQTPGPAPASPTPVPNSPFSILNSATQWRFEQISEDHLRFIGQVDMEVGSMTRFFADEIEIFTDPTLRLVATGNVVFDSPEGRISAERVEFNVEMRTGTFYQASGILSLGGRADPALFAGQDPDVYFYGDTIEKLSDRSYKLTRGGFSTCVQPTPRWEVTSKSVMINLDQYAIARNMLLRVKGVPLMYLPVIYYPIKEDNRATGFLLPTYGTSSVRGQTLSNAFFWAIGRSQDATFFHDWFTQTGQGVGAEYRYAAAAGSFGNFRFYRIGQHQAEYRQGGSVSILPNRTSYQFNGTGSQVFTPTLQLRSRFDYSSDITTQQLYQQNVYQASNASRTLQSSLMGNWTALSLNAQFQRTETFANSENSQVYGSTPGVTAVVAPQRLFGMPVYGSLNADAAYLPFRTLKNGKVVAGTDKSLARFDALPTVRAALSRLTFLTVNTSAQYRTTYYTRSADTRAETRGQPIDTALTRQYMSLKSEVIGPVFTKIWETPDSRLSERMKHLIEPTWAVEYLTTVKNYRQVLTLSDSSDVIIGGASRFTYGLNNRFMYRARTQDGSRGSTVEFITVGLQQTYYTNPDLSRFDPQYVSSQHAERLSRVSPASLTVRVSPSTALESSSRLEYNTERGFLQAAAVGATGRTVGGSTLNVSFSRSRSSRTSKPSSTLSSGTSLRFLQGRAVGSYALNWDIGQGFIVNQGTSFTYMAQCCGIQAEFQKYHFPQANPNFPIASDRRINIGFVLAGLGTFSNLFGAFGGFLGLGP